jgi:TM2 domain-containing membrane protein YozV
MGKAAELRVLCGNVIHGPFNRGQVQDLVVRGRLAGSDLVSVQGGQWVRISEYLGEASPSHVTERPATPAPPVKSAAPPAASSAATGATSSKHCVECGEMIRERAEICPHCGVRQPPSINGQVRHGDHKDFVGKKVVAGVFGLLLGSLGIHKFVLGLSSAGFIMLLVSILTCGFGAIPMGIIGLIEGIIYLSKNEQAFYEDYAVRRKGWF